MGNFLSGLDLGTTPDYINALSRYNASGETYGVLTSSLGNYTSLNLGCQLRSQVTTSRWQHNTWLDLALDLTEYSLCNFASGTITAYTKAFSNYSLWGTADRDSVTFVPQRETVRGTGHSNATNYQETYNGMTTDEFTNRVQLASMSVGTKNTWTLNTNGLAYINSVKDKANNPGYAFMSMVWGGQADSVAPSYTYPAEQTAYFEDVGFQILLGFSTPIYVNIGDTWEEVVGIKINQTGTAWADVSDLNINIGDAWKDILV